MEAMPPRVTLAPAPAVSVVITHQTLRALKELREGERVLVEALRTDNRQLIVASVELGYSYEQLAEATGRASPDAARKAARRALVKLAEEMESG